MPNVSKPIKIEQNQPLKISSHSQVTQAFMKFRFNKVNLKANE
ncbi:hypothetical protein AALB_0862 [Agarivorans albus MKT 106]|uniref:Uncharacterized protein n=1 Tax=Agarivorans albus MKT 106 TaxID=1331007 RepID=R9PHH5_AGAAL|nr:hypothetical protein AALB_0862 [Agarivorans albus MKT 106]